MFVFAFLWPCFCVGALMFLGWCSFDVFAEFFRFKVTVVMFLLQGCCFCVDEVVFLHTFFAGCFVMMVDAVAVSFC